MDDLTADSVMELHSGIMERDGGDTRLVSEAALHQMIFQANLADTPFSRAALVLYWLSSFQVFREGNCRSARAIAVKIFDSEGYDVELGGDGFPGLIRGIGTFTVDADGIEDWLRSHARKRN